MAGEPAGGGEKTEKPTAKRLADAAKDGDILQSRELATALVTMAGLVWLAMAGPAMMGSMKQMLTEGLRFSATDVTGFAPEQRAARLLSVIALPVAGFMAVTFLAAIAAPALLGSLGFRPGAFKPKASKINPMNGLKRMFGPQGLIELVKSLAKILLMGAVGGYLLWDRFAAISVMGRNGSESAATEMGSLFIIVALALGGTLFVIAGIDVPAQAFQRGKRLAMTFQEVKEEHKEAEGSPEAKQAIRRRQFATLNGSVRQAVQEASVVLTNPTHFAVALRYHPGRDRAPVVLARGADDIAAAMRKLAEEKAVPMLQYPELTRAIFYTSRVGEAIDERLFLAVATILAFVFRIESKLASEMDRPHIDLPDALRFDAEGKNIVN
jgi:flagellar biosynthesis protein FlhB